MKDNLGDAFFDQLEISWSNESVISDEKEMLENGQEIWLCRAICGEVPQHLKTFPAVLHFKSQMVKLLKKFIVIFLLQK